MALQLETTLSTVVAVAFRCAHCQRQARALVHSEGVGTASGTWSAKQMKRAAQETAEARLVENAELLAKYAPCPACGRRDDALLASARRTLGVLSGLAATGAAAVAWLFGTRLTTLMVPLDGLAVLAIATAAVLAAWRTWLSQSWKWTEAKSRVRFEFPP